MRITVRIPDSVPYAYVEVEYESIEEYKKEHPEFARAMIETSTRAKQFAAAANTAQQL